MKQILTLLGVLLLFLPGALAGDVIQQSIGITLPSTSAAVSQVGGNTYVVDNGGSGLPYENPTASHSEPGNPDIDSITQSVAYGATSSGSSVTQENYNYIDLNGIEGDSMDDIDIIQTISQTADAATDVLQEAVNVIVGTEDDDGWFLQFGPDAQVSQTINQLATAGGDVDQEANNFITDDIDIGSLVLFGSGDGATITQEITQTAVADGFISQNTIADDIPYDVFPDENPGFTMPDNDVANYIGGDVCGEGNTITQSIEQVAISNEDAVDQESAGSNDELYWFDSYTNYVGNVYGDSNSITQEVVQAALAHGDLDQDNVDGSYGYSAANHIGYVGPVFIFGSEDLNEFAQDAQQIGVSNAGSVYQNTETFYVNINEIGELDGTDNHVSQNVLQAAASFAPIVPEIDQDGYSANDIFGVIGDENEITQTLTQIAVAEDGFIVQDAYGEDFGANEIDPGIPGETNTLTQAVLQAALGGEGVEQYVGSGNYITEITGEDNSVDQGIDQFGIATGNDVIQDAARDDAGNPLAGNLIPSATGEDLVLTQDILQAGVTTDQGYLYQLALNSMESVDTSVEHSVPVFTQGITQIGIADAEMRQSAENDITVTTEDDVEVNQNIFDVVQWGAILDRDAYNFADITGDDILGTATVNQGIDTVNVGTDALGDGSSTQTNEIIDNFAGSLVATQDPNDAAILGVWASPFVFTPNNIIT